MTLSKLFGGSIARVLDQALIVGNMEQSIDMLSESTGLAYGYVEHALSHLRRLNLVKKTKKGTYRFNLKKLAPILNLAEKLR